METRDFILGAIVAVLTLVLRDGGPIITKWLNWTTADRKIRAELESKGYEAVICRLDKQVIKLENDVKSLVGELNVSRQREHDCEIRFARMEEELKNMKELYESS